MEQTPFEVNCEIPMINARGDIYAWETIRTNFITFSNDYDFIIVKTRFGKILKVPIDKATVVSWKESLR